MWNQLQYCEELRKTPQEATADGGPSSMLPNGTHQSMVCQKAQCRQGSLQSEQEQSKQCPCSPRQHPIADVELSKCCLRHWSSRNHCAQVWEVLPPNSTCECSLSCPIESEDQMTRHQMQKEHALVQASSQHSLEWRAHLDSQRSACLASQHQDSVQGRNAAPLHQENQDQQPSRDHQDSRHDPQQHAQLDHPWGCGSAWWTPGSRTSPALSPADPGPLLRRIGKGPRVCLRRT
mmetsp:Transcript_5517/g.14278  ORF Transcript_5517/g.14278 Transcript_5517/m.14278 type:complete len:234 (+) Transcript_5517:768-1469(+)